MNSVLNFAVGRDVFGAGAVDEARERPGLRHFEGPAANKPWHVLCDAPGASLLEHRRQHAVAATCAARARRRGNVVRRVLRPPQCLTAIRPV